MGSFRRLVLLGVIICFIKTSDGSRCPPPSWIKPTRTCISDKECYPELCCPDYLGRKSCARPQLFRGYGTMIIADMHTPVVYGEGDINADQKPEPPLREVLVAVLKQFRERSRAKDSSTGFNFLRWILYSVDYPEGEK